MMPELAMDSPRVMFLVSGNLRRVRVGNVGSAHAQENIF